MLQRKSLELNHALYERGLSTNGPSAEEFAYRTSSPHSGHQGIGFDIERSAPVQLALALTVVVCSHKVDF